MDNYNANMAVNAITGKGAPKCKTPSVTKGKTGVVKDANSGMKKQLNASAAKKMKPIT